VHRIVELNKAEAADLPIEKMTVRPHPAADQKTEG
jgi:hypothetical protein